MAQYVPLKTENDFCNSVIESNHALLFSESTENGIVIKAKISDGSFINVVDPRANGLKTGLETLTGETLASIAAGITSLNNSKSDIRNAIAEKGQTCTTSTPLADYADLIEDIQSGADVTLGQIVNGQFVPQVFNGTSATAGTPESFTDVYTFNTAQEAAGGGAASLAELYKISSVSGTTYQGKKATAYDSASGTWTFSSSAETLSAATAPSIDYLYAAVNKTLLGGSLAYVGDYPADSAPNGVMTGNNSASDGTDWIVSGNMYNRSSSEQYFAFKAGNSDVLSFNSGCHLDWYSATPRLVKRISIGGLTAGTVMLQGSNDGSAWVDIGTCSILASQTSTTTFPDNTTGYTYHRLMQYSSSYPWMATAYAYSTLA